MEKPKPQVLLIEKYQDTAKIIIEVLGKTHGIKPEQIYSFPTGRNALTFLENNNFIPDVAIINIGNWDLKLGDIDGESIIRQFRQAGSPYINVPIIAISTMPEDTLAKVSSELGVNRFLEKPFTTLTILGDTIMEVLPPQHNNSR